MGAGYRACKSSPQRNEGQREQTMKTIKKQKTAESVGIFFVINNEVIAHLEPIASLQAIDDFYDAELGHSDWFDASLNKQYPQFEQYMDIPRGRIVKDIKNDLFIVYLDKSLDTAAMRKKIIKTFNLPNKKNTFEYDSHYTTNLDEIDELFRDRW
jgi:hypothetical protein